MLEGWDALEALFDQPNPTDADANIVLEYNSNAATGDATQNWKANTSFIWTNKMGIPKPVPATLGSDTLTKLYVTNPDANKTLRAVIRLGVVN